MFEKVLLSAYGKFPVIPFSKRARIGISHPSSARCAPSFALVPVCSSGQPTSSAVTFGPRLSQSDWLALCTSPAQYEYDERDVYIYGAAGATQRMGDVRPDSVGDRVGS